MAVATVLHQGGKLVQLNSSFPLVFVSHQVRHPRHVVPYILAHGDFYRLAPPVTGAVNVYGAYPRTEAGQPAEQQERPDEVPRRWPHRGGGAGSRARGWSAAPSLPPSLTPSRRRWGRAGRGAGGGGGHFSGRTAPVWDSIAPDLGEGAGRRGTAADRSA